ncbi:MAG: uL15 family ribosomal protein [Candidatus Hydrothermarchaeota archaeon]
MATKDRKIRKKRGSRTCGGGSHKKSRNSGSRGGKGMAGTHKGKWSWIIKFDPEHFGDRGFQIPAAVKEVYQGINVGELDESLARLMKEGIATEREGGYLIDLGTVGKVKVLGGGKVRHPLTIKASGFSGTAVEKIEASGGKALVLGGEGAKAE